MQEPKVIEKIFGITNELNFKVIYIFGIPIKLRSDILFNLFYKNKRINNKKIVFANFKGNGFGCNAKYIALEIIKRKLPYELVWLVKNPSEEDLLKEFPTSIRIVNFRKHQALKELATAKIWIDNQRKIYHVKKGLSKKENQHYIQTWHGSLGIKKIGMDSNWTTAAPEWVPYGKADAKMIDYITSNSNFESDVYKRNFWGNGKILKYGHPRNDIFFTDTNKIRTKVLEKLGIDKNKKICLYVPSYRDDGRIYCFGLEYNELQKTLNEKFGTDWLILVRMHPNFRKYQEYLIPQKENIINVSEYPDIQELLVTADIAITDYSSCIFDFMLSRKPAFIYASDMEEFDNSRGFYYPLTSTPFPVAKSNEELRKNIANFNYDTYKQNVEEFLQDKGCMEDGKASERVVNLIEEIMNNK